MNKWTTDVEGFIQAVEDDEYAELELSNGDTLITDWESDGSFYPYVQPKHGHGIHDTDDRLDEVAMAIERKLDVEVSGMEWDENNGVFVPWMNRPTHD